MGISATEKDRFATLYAAADASREPDVLLTVHELAHLLNVPASWVYERTRRRGAERLPHIKIGKYIRFRREDIVGWLDAYKI